MIRNVRFAPGEFEKQLRSLSVTCVQSLDLTGVQLNDSERRALLEYINLNCCIQRIEPESILGEDKEGEKAIETLAARAALAIPIISDKTLKVYVMKTPEPDPEKCYQYLIENKFDSEPIFDKWNEWFVKQGKASLFAEICALFIEKHEFDLKSMI